MRQLAVLAFAAPAFAQTDVTDRFAVPEGLRVTLWAESPQLYNPTAFDIDARGRVWVTEGVNYRKWNGRNPGRDHPKGDRIVILEDTDGDGRCDSSTVFAQDEDLLVPLGIAVVGDRVLVSCSPSIFVYRDTDGDDRADEREVFLTGFGGRDHDHGVHSLVVGPDGELYGNAGNEGPHVVTDRDGFTLRTGTGREWIGGIVFKLGADGRGLRPLADNFRNNYEVAVDAFGDMFQSDNDDDGNRSCRTLWVMEGGDHGFTSADGSRRWRADRRPGQSIQTAHWHQDDPGVVPAGCINGAGGPTGVAIYEGSLLDGLDGAVLNADSGRSLVYAHRPKLSGGGFELEPSVLIEPKGRYERSQWFRPSDVAVSHDGAIWVADWFDPGVGGHGMGDREAYGRILRIAPAGQPPTPTLNVTDLDTALEALDSPAVNVRWLGQRWLRANADRAAPALTRRLDDPEPRRRARSLWLLAELDASAARGEWNRYEITLNGGDLRLSVNGVVQNTATDCERVPGEICLQSEGAEIQFRNIRLREIRK